MRKYRLDAEKMFLDNIEPTDTDCWNWTREIHKTTGYGRFTENNIQWHAHRFSYIYFKGAIPYRYHVHHLCNNRWCINPDHLEAISAAEHVMKGNTITAKNIKKTHCKNGHAFTNENTYIRPRKNGGRDCRICRNAAVKRFLS